MFGYSVNLAAVAKRLTLVFLVAACANPDATTPPVSRAAQAEPHQAILYRNTITVEFTDGALCVAKRPGAAQTWAGQLAGCSYTLPYRALLPGAALAPRQVLVRLTTGQRVVLLVGETQFGLPGAAS